MTRISTKIAAVFAMCMLLGGASAFAQSPATTVYDPNGGVGNVVSPAPGKPAAGPESAPPPAASPAPTADSGVAGESESDDRDGQAVASSGANNSSGGGAAGAESTANRPTTPSELESGAAATQAGATTQASADTLPFTGFEVGFIVAAGFALLAGGIALRRAAQG